MTYQDKIKEAIGAADMFSRIAEECGHEEMSTIDVLDILATCGLVLTVDANLATSAYYANLKDA